MLMLFDVPPSWYLLVLLSISSVLAINLSRRAARRTTALRGPPNPSRLFGATKRLAESPGSGRLYEQWAEEYGSVFSMPCGLGRSCIVLCDPTAIQHFYTRETRVYVHTSLLRAFTERVVSEML